jgi:TATA-box binding protein (TBP) (component of TFIID and TFIIIB)
MAQQLSRDLVASIAHLRSRRHRGMQPSPVNLTTMTITAALNLTKVCHQSLLLAAELAGDSGPITKAPDKKRKAKKRKAPEADSRDPEFYNQVTLQHGTKSIKVFKNGSLQVTGCKSPLQFLGIAEDMCRFMEDDAGMGSMMGHIHVTDFRVQMINLNFEVGTALYLALLRDMFISKGHMASYDADVYPGLNVKLRLQTGAMVTVLVFRSGKLIITGAKTAPDMEAAYSQVMLVLEEFVAREKVGTPKNKM